MSEHKALTSAFWFQKDQWSGCPHREEVEGMSVKADNQVNEDSLKEQIWYWTGGYGCHLARYALITVGEADHPRSLAHPKHDHSGQHLHAYPAEHQWNAGDFQSCKVLIAKYCMKKNGVDLTCPIPTHMDEGNLCDKSLSQFRGTWLILSNWIVKHGFIKHDCWPQPQINSCHGLLDIAMLAPLFSRLNFQVLR